MKRWSHNNDSLFLHHTGDNNRAYIYKCIKGGLVC